MQHKNRIANNVERRVTATEAMVLLYNLYHCDKVLGLGDVYNTLDDLARHISFQLYIRKDVMDSLLWSANMLDEAGKFWHPRNRDFKSFVKQIEKRNEAKFNPAYSWLKDDKDE